MVRTRRSPRVAGEVMVGVRKLAPAGGLPRALGDRGWFMSRDAAMVAPLLAHHSAMALRFFGHLGFLHKHSQLWSSSLPSTQAVSSQPTAVPSLGLLLKPTFQHPAPLHTGRHPSQAETCRTVAQTICVGLTLSCLPQSGCWAPLQAPKAPLLSQLISPSVRGLPQMREPLFTLSSLPGVQVPPCFPASSFPLLSFLLPGYVGIFLVLLGVRDPLLVFSRCCVRMVPFVHVFLMRLWGEMNSTSSYSSTIFESPLL